MKRQPVGRPLIEKIMPIAVPFNRRQDRLSFRATCRIAFASLFCLALIVLSKPAQGQFFFYGSGPFGQGFGIGIGPGPGFPPPLPFIPPPGFGSPPHPPGYLPSRWAMGFPDYRLEYNLRIQQMHALQMEQLRLSREFATPIHTRSYPVDEASTMLEGVPIPYRPQADEDAIEDTDVLFAGLVSAARRLDTALANHGETGQVWRQYLSTDLLANADTHPMTDSEWRKVLQSFDGTVANQSLRWIAQVDGFSETRRRLTDWVHAKAVSVDQAEESSAPANDPQTGSGPGKAGIEEKEEPVFEILPTPVRAKL